MENWIKLFLLKTIPIIKYINIYNKFFTYEAVIEKIW